MTNRLPDNHSRSQPMKPPRRRFLKTHRRRARGARLVDAALDLNRLTAEAAAGVLDERRLMDGALNILANLVGAVGCSFVPVDEWQQPLPPFTFGRLPAPVMTAWTANLASGLLRERCGVCSVLHSSPGSCPLHPIEAGEALGVYCLPLTGIGETLEQAVSDRRTGRTQGVLNLYLPEGRSLNAALRKFLERVLPDIALAYQSARLRSREAATMRQLNLHNDAESDITTLLNGLLDGLLGALDADFALLRLLPATGAEFSNRPVDLNLQRAKVEIDPQEFQCLLDAALASFQADGLAASASYALPVWIACSLSQPAANGPAHPPSAAGMQGVVLAGSHRPRTFQPRQQAILQAVTAHAALLIGFERRSRALEYSIVIQERARLAREIHDGLAQTLAFLKLQAAQMQAQLAQGDLDRLAQVLNDSYHVLGEAYLDTRQAIDNLRLTPQDGLEQWIERIIREYERKAGIKAERCIQPLARSVPPEIQAQLIRIVQEALNNIRKHARAVHTRVSLCEQGGMLVIEVTDDGQGFEADELPDVSRHGLRGMRERAESIGADFQLISQPRQGTSIRLAVPVWSQEERAA